MTNANPSPEYWRDLGEAPPETPVIAQYCEWDKPGGELREHVVWFFDGAWRSYPRTDDRAYANRWRPMPALSQTLPAPPLSTDVQSAATGFHEQDVSLKVALPAPGEVERMRAALKPFADACNFTTADDSESLYDTLAAEKLTWRDLRSARAALAVSPTLATVAAANDEGVAEAVNALESIAAFGEVRIQDGQDMGASVWRLALEDIVHDARAAIRLLSQGGVK